MPANDNSIFEIVRDVNTLAASVLSQVAELGAGGGAAARSIEKTVLEGIDAGMDAFQELSQRLESAQRSRQDIEPIAEALAQVEQKLNFFRGCTMRRSAAGASDEEQAAGYAAEAERLAAAACAAPRVDQLVETYKRLEQLEARIVDLRGSTRASGVPEPRVLDLPRARVLTARRIVGSAVSEMDSDEDE